MLRTSRTILLVLFLVATVACSEGGAQNAPEQSATGAPLCGWGGTPPPTYAHVIWIFFENHGFGQIVGSGAAPFIDRTLVPSCGLATNYHNLTHPSVPNYIAATSGLSLGHLGPLRGDCNATGACRSNADSIFARAPSWRAYAESMPKPCTHWFKSPYAASHNPAVYYRRLTDCAQNDLPIRALQADLDADTLPAFAFIVPNMCNSMHDCSVGTGDAWLAGMIRRLTASPAYRSGSTAIFVTWDEGEKGGSDQCAHNQNDPGCRVATLVISPYTTPGTRDGTLFNHYSLLRTTEELLGIETFLGRAADATSMRAAFNL